MFCKNCGKEISDNAYVCPSCGAKTTQEIVYQSNSAAVVGFIFSLIPFFGSIIGFIISLAALKKSKRTNGNGRGLATAGLTISGIYFFMILLFVIILSTLSSLQ